jgi:hypothetical protein
MFKKLFLVVCDQNCGGDAEKIWALDEEAANARLESSGWWVSEVDGFPSSHICPTCVENKPELRAVKAASLTAGAAGFAGE